MPLPWALRGLRNGVLTTKWPHRADAYFDNFPASIEVRNGPFAIEQHQESTTQSALDKLCPTGAIGVVEAGSSTEVVIDHGRCIRCGRCIEQAPELFGWQPGSATARLTRTELVSGSHVEDDRAVQALREQLAHRVRRLRRSVHIRHVDAGSDGSDEWEVQALLNPVYDIHRLGIFFTASPRHADVLLVTGLGAPGMVAPLRRTREAMPDPVVVIAAGTDAVSGGLMRDGYGSAAGVSEILAVDVWVPGSPASPFSLMHGILLALGRLPLPESERRRR